MKLAAAALLLFAGCSTQQVQQTGGALSMTSALVVALPLIPFVDVYHAVSGDIVKDTKKRDAIIAQLDAVYAQRIAMLSARDAIKDADAAFESGKLGFLATDPGGDLFSGLSPSWRNPAVRPDNSAVVRASEFLNYLQTLVARDPVDEPGNEAFIFSKNRSKFQDACWRYRTSFNREMYRRITGIEATKPPRPMALPGHS